MLNNRISRREALVLPLALSLCSLFFNGCGSGNSLSVSGRAMPVEMTIAWPERGTSRYIPAYAASIVLTIFPKNATSNIQTLIVNRPSNAPSTQTVRFTQLFVPGEYVLVGNAFSQEAGGGTLVATASSTVTVVADEIAKASLSLSSTIKSLQISYYNPFRLEEDTVLSAANLVAASGFSNIIFLVEAKNADNASVFLPVDGLRFNTGNASITLNARNFARNGISLSMNGSGSGTLSITEVGANITSNAIPLRVEPLNSPNLCWIATDFSLNSIGSTLAIYDLVSKNFYYQGEVYLPIANTRISTQLYDIAWGKDTAGNPTLLGLDLSGNIGELKYNNLSKPDELINVLNQTTLPGYDLQPGKTLPTNISAYGLEAGSGSSIYVLSSRTIEVFPSLTADKIDTYTFPSNFAAQGDVCIDSAGNLYASSSFGSSVWKIPAGSHTPQPLGTQTSDRFSGMALINGRLMGFSGKLPDYNVLDINTSTGALTVISKGLIGTVLGASRGPI
jgi:hypothetical protein